MKTLTISCLLFLGFGCGVDEAVLLQNVERDDRVATHYAIHVGGVCSTDYLVGKGRGVLGEFENVVSVNARVNQRTTMAAATSDLRDVLDDYCTGEDWCTVFTFSNGGALISRALSFYGDDWNILNVVATASNEGGSELSRWGRAGEIFTSCDMLDAVSPTDHRSGWNHHDTAGAIFYMVAGYKCMAPWIQCLLLPGEDDGAVAYHSAGGMSDVFSTTELCGDEPRYSNHEVAFCDGFRKTHYQMKNEGVCQAGGC